MWSPGFFFHSSAFLSGAEGSRTLGLYNANVALSQLSYCPILFFEIKKT